MSKTFDRRSFLAGGVALGAGAVLLGNADWASAALTNGPGRNGIGKGTPKRGGSLVMGIDTEEDGFDPTSARWDEGGFLYGRTIFDPLAIVTAAGAVQPYLAQSITPNADYTAWTITLRSGIVFHDGTPLNAAALQLNLTKQQASPLVGPAFAAYIKGSEVTGPLSVTINMKAPWVPFDFFLAQAQTGYIAAPSMLNSPTGTSHPVGTGPFVFQEWIPNSHFTATANPHYWRPGLPYLDSITFKPIIVPTSRRAPSTSCTRTRPPVFWSSGATRSGPTSTTAARFWASQRSTASCSIQVHHRSTTRSCARPWPWAAAPSSTPKRST
jgi:peptide/nickel transport system substrate-binding protein